ncbi:MAG: hypothetical protein L6265_05915, partial [Thermoplasmatales archaeon]|nr:hypothetical protein [Thermoplasmatales archaeon]
MNRITTMILICVIMLSLFPLHTECQTENNQNNVQTQVSSGGWEQEWVGGFGIIRDLKYAENNQLFVAGSSVIHIINTSTYKTEKQLFGHTARIQCVALSQDNNRLASASADSTVKIWDMDKVVKSFTISMHAALSVDWSSDGNKIATGADDSRLKIWNVSTGEILIDVKAHNDGITTLEFSPDGKMIATGAGFSNIEVPGGAGSESLDTTVKLWNSTNGELIRTMEGHEDGITKVRFSSDGKYLASSSIDTNIKIWDVNNGDCIRTLEGHTGDVNDIRWSDNGKKIVSCSSDYTIKIWDIEKGEVIKEFENEMDGTNVIVWSVAWLNTEEVIVSGDDRCRLKFWDIENGIIHEMGEHYRDILSVDGSPDGSKIASCAGDSTIRIWDAETSECINILEEHGGYYVYDVSWSPDGKWLASCDGNGYDSTVIIWSADGKLYKIFKGHTGDIYEVSWSPDSKKLVSASQDFTLKIWDIGTDLEATLRGHHERVKGCDWSPKGDKIVSVDYARTMNTIIWELEGNTWGISKVFTSHDGYTECVKWCNDGSKFATGAWKSIKVWDEDGKFIKNLGPHGYTVNEIDWRTGDDFLVSCAKEIFIWDYAEADIAGSLRGHDTLAGWPYIAGVAWLSDKKIVSGGGDITVRTWRATLGISAEMEMEMLSQEENQINIHISYLGEAVPDASITVSSDSGSFSHVTGTTDRNGDFRTTFYAPTVDKNRTCNIIITASKLGSGFADGRIIIPITIYPKILLVDVEGETNVSSGENSTIKIHVSNYVGPVKNADVIISSEYVIPTTGKTDENGKLVVTFNAPETNTEKTCAIMITASKGGYTEVQSTFNINVKPEAEKPSAPPLIYLLVFIS